MPRSPSPADDGQVGTDDGTDAGLDTSPDAGTTVDTLLRGRVTLIQPQRGFRSSLDPVLLARFLAPPFGRFVDIGCGTGALSFTLLADDADATGVGVELQPRLARLAARGREHNRFGERFEIREGDVRTLAGALAARPFDLVATNPPFRPLARGLSSPDEERALANHEVALSLSEWLDCAVALVRPGGRLGVVYPAGRVAELLAGMTARDLSPVRLRSVHPFAGRAAGRVLVEAQRGSRRTLTIEPSLIVHSGQGNRFTAEAETMLDAHAPDRAAAPPVA
jgi:tRNA1Val (adenine37-N6)-methyltransferase